MTSVRPSHKLRKGLANLSDAPSDPLNAASPPDGDESLADEEDLEDLDELPDHLPVHVVQALQAIQDRLEHRLERRVEIRMAEYFQGPLPHPRTLEGYERVVPGAANRVLVQFEEQSLHRRTMESRVVGSDIGRSRQGLWMGGALAFSFGVFSLILGLAGHPWPGTVLGGSTLTAVAATFVYGTHSRRSEVEGRPQPPDDEA